MSKATPGPWRFEEVDGNWGDILGPSNEHVVCFGHDYDEYGEISSVADAHLIASAPELAAILIEYERIEAEIIFDDACWNTELPQHYYDRLIELQHKRNEALEKAGYSFERRAKATGGEHA